MMPIIVIQYSGCWLFVYNEGIQYLPFPLPLVFLHLPLMPLPFPLVPLLLLGAPFLFVLQSLRQEKEN